MGSAHSIANANNIHDVSHDLGTPRLNPAAIFVNGLALVYVVSVYLLIAVEGYSRVSIATAVLLWAAIFVYALSVGKLSWSHLIWIPLSFGAFNLMSVAWASDAEAGFSSAAQTLSAILGGTGIWLALNNGLSWKTLAWSAVLGAIVLVFSARAEVAESGIAGRAAGLTGNANALAICLFYAAFIVWCAPAKLPWWLHLLGWAFAAYAVLFTGSRKSLALLAVAILLAAIRYAPRLLYLRTWLLLGLGVLLVAAALGTRVLDLERIGVAETLQSTQSVTRLLNLIDRRENLRFEMAHDAVVLWQKSPVWGHGAGQFMVLTRYGLYSHNNYAELLADYGLVGFVLFYFLHAALLVRLAPGAVRWRRESLMALLLLLLVLVLDVAMVSFSGKVSWVFLAAVVRLATAGDSRPDPSQLAPQSRRLAHPWSRSV